MKSHQKAIVIISGVILLSACSNVISSCRSCIDHDESKPVKATDLAKIKIIRGDTMLPQSARNVYFFEECGIDCAQKIRFDMPPAEASVFAQKLAGAPLAPVENGSLSPTDPDTKLAWWPVKMEKGMSVSSTQADALYIFVAPNGANATVYIHNFSM